MGDPKSKFRYMGGNTYPELHKFPHFALDTETTGLMWWVHKLFGFSISTPDGKDYYFDIREQPKALTWLRDQLKRYSGTVCGHNLKFDIHMLREAGVWVPPRTMFCTLIAATLIDEHLTHYGLDYVGNKYVKFGKQEDIWEKLAKVHGGEATAKAQAQYLHQAPAKLVGPYAAQDTRAALNLYEWQMEQIREEKLEAITSLEMHLLPVVIDMEHRGVRVDLKEAEKAAHYLTGLIDTSQKGIDKDAGFPVNCNPSGSIHRLFEPIQLPNGSWIAKDGTPLPSTPAGKACLNADALRTLKDPMGLRVIRQRKLIRARDVFILGHVLGHHHKGVIHANINQAKTEGDQGTGTGRFSITQPALQQMSARDGELAQIVRSLFLPDKGQEWLSLDQDQVDFRVCAHYINDPRLNEVYAKDPSADFHTTVANMTNLPRTPEYAGQANAKQVNLGLAFNMGSGKLAKQMGLEYTVETDPKTGRVWLRPGPEAQAVFEQYHGMFPNMKIFSSRASDVVKEQGYVRSLLGRKLRFPDRTFSYKASGLLFQAGTADLMKSAMVEIYESLAGTASRLSLTVHDEVAISSGKDKKSRDLDKEIHRCMTDHTKHTFPIKLRIPITAKMGRGKNWYEAGENA